MFNQKLKITPIITTVITLAISVQIFAQGQRARDWERDFYGTPSFNLGDDQRLNTLRHKAKTAKANLANAASQHQKSKKNLQILVKSKKDKNSKKLSLTNKIKNKKQKNIELTQKKTAVKTKLSTFTATLEATKVQKAAAKNALTRVSEKLLQLKTKYQNKKTSCEQNQTPACQSKVLVLSQKVAAQNKLVTAKKKQLQQKNKEIKYLQAKKQEMTKSLASMQAQIVQNNKIIQTSKTQKQQLVVKITALTSKIQTAKTKTAQLNNIKTKKQAQFDTFKTKRNRYKKRLVTRILEVNSHGADIGARDGSSDGATLSYRLGGEYGSADGTKQGHNNGEHDGMQRDRQAGYESGMIDGARRAVKEANLDGRKAGTIQGNIDAATALATIHGIQMALDSDASKVGSKQGTGAGHVRAAITGKIQGTQIGEAKAINFYESKNLKKVSVDGNFTGTFSSSMPTFPINFTGQNFKPYSNYGRLVVKTAYEDGYKFVYYSQIRKAFYQNIEHDYSTAFNDHQTAAYNKAFSRQYPNSRKNGYHHGEKTAFDRDYPSLYQSAYNSARDDFASSPNIHSSEYKSTYHNVKAAVYDKRYEEIRQDSYTDLELKTYNANITEQIKKYEGYRFEDVSNVYKTSPVLKYVKSNILDMGIDGIAKLDDVFQPKENILFDIEIKNYGLVPAKGAIVSINGKKMALASIPASSSAIIKSAAKSKVMATEGHYDKQSVQLSYKLTKEKKIQGKYFADSTSGILNIQDTKSNIVKYPLILNSLKSLDTIIIGKDTHLGINISNASGKKYSGTLKVDLISNDYDAVVTNSFEVPSTLDVSSSQKLVNAKVLVKDTRSVLKPISFSANVYKDGVLLGHTSSNYTTMAKMVYTDIVNAPVISFNSFQSTSKVRSLIEKFGGTGKVSLLDFSLVSQNFKAISKGLKSKDVVIVAKRNQRIDQDMKLFIEQSKNMTYILSHDKSFYRNIKSINKFQETKDFKLNLKGLNFPILLAMSNSKKQDDNSNVIYSNDLTFTDILTLSKYLKLSNNDLVNSLKTIAYQDFLNLSKENLLLVQAVHLRSLSELLFINTQYKKSDEDEDILEQIEDDKNLIHNLLREEIKKYSDDDAGLFLFAYDYYEVLDFALNEWNEVEDEIDSDLTKVLFGGWFSGGHLKPFKKVGKLLKKEIKSTYKKAKKQIGHTAPFEFED